MGGGGEDTGVKWARFMTTPGNYWWLAGYRETPKIILNTLKGPVKLIKRVKIAHSFYSLCQISSTPGGGGHLNVT